MSDSELPVSDHILPEYYDKYRLVFSHYQLDRKIGRIGVNEYQKRFTRFTTSNRRADEPYDAWNNFDVSRKAAHIQRIDTTGRENSRSYRKLN